LEEIEAGATIILKLVIKFEPEEFKWIVVAQYWENWIALVNPK
jgi:hypothetical protein